MKQLKRKQLIFSIVAIVLFAFQAFYNLDENPIKIWDEARGALNAIEMMENNDYLVVTAYGEPDYWNSKPPLFVWLKVISYKIFGINEFAVRLPSAVAAVITGFVLLLFSQVLLNNLWPGILSVIILATTRGYMGYHVARYGEPDSLLILFVTCYSFLFYYFLQTYPRKRNIFFVLMSLLVVLAVYTKSIAGLAPIAGLVLFGLFFKNFYLLLKDYRLYLSLFLIILSVLSYYLIRNIYDPGYIHQVLKTELGLFSDYYVGVPKHPQKSFYFNYLYESGFYPYVYLAIILLPAIIFIKVKEIKHFAFFNLLQALVIISGFSLSVTKNEWYISTAYPFMAALLGILFYQTINFLINFKLDTKVRFSILILIIIGLTLLFYRQYIVVLDQNKFKPMHSYNLEWEGEGIRNIIQNYDDLKTLNVLKIPKYSQKELDQVYFYKLKYENEKNIEIKIQTSKESIFTQEEYLVCSEKLFNLIKLNTYFKIIDTITKNCIYVKVDSIKNVSEINYTNTLF